MARQTVVQGHWQYVVNAEADLRVGQQPWALVKVDLQDELTARSLTTPATITSPDHPEFTGIARPDGGAGLAGVPSNVLSKLKAINYPGVIAVNADGYVPDSQKFNILPNGSFPDDFQPLGPVPWPLHRLPVNLYGQVSLLTGTMVKPLVGAQVSITKIWRQMPSPVTSPPPDPFDPAAVRPTLSAVRLTGANIRQQPLALVASKFVLLQEVQSGDSSLTLSDTVGLSAGQILAFDRVDPDYSEFVAIKAITGSSGPNQPATVQLEFPLAYRHKKVEHVSAGALGPLNKLGVDAIAGDTVLLANSLSGIGSPDVVEISGGIPSAEYRTLRSFTVVSVALGLYRLPPLSRVAQLELTASDGVHLPVSQIVVPDYREEENRVDFTLH